MFMLCGTFENNEKTGKNVKPRQEDISEISGKQIDVIFENTCISSNLNVPRSRTTTAQSTVNGI